MKKLQDFIKEYGVLLSFGCFFLLAVSASASFIIQGLGIRTQILPYITQTKDSLDKKIDERWKTQETRIDLLSDIEEQNARLGK